VEVLLGASKPLREWRSSASLGWRWQKDVGLVSGWLGASAGGGFILQETASSTRVSALGSVAPFVGFGTRIEKAAGIWSKVAAPLLVFRRDAKLTASVAPSAWLGGTLDF